MTLTTSEILSSALAVAAATLLCTAAFAEPQRADTTRNPEPTHHVWLDVDPANGIGEVDDGLAMVQAFHSPELEIHGVSVVFGNAALEHALPIALNVTRTFGPEGVPVLAGAASAEQLGEITPAVEAMAQALEQRPLTILALGPLTNVGTLVQHRPDLVERIEEVIVVAGRRPGLEFISVEAQPEPFGDFNFEHDPAAAQALLGSGVKIVFAPWEVSSHVWITRDDLAKLKARGGSGLWVFSVTQHWIRGWEQRLGALGFNPFDTLAVGYLTHPEQMKGFACEASIVQVDADDPEAAPHWVAREREDGPHVYLHTPTPAFKQTLLQRLSPSPESK